jgi:selenide,water dikinase
MMQLNKVGAILGKVKGVNAMTDVTGFGLLGHLIEMAEGSGLSAVLNFSKVPLIAEHLVDYVELGAVPGGTNRNWDSYGHKVRLENKSVAHLQKNILADPQTSGGLLIAVSKESLGEVIEILQENGLAERTSPIGELINPGGFAVSVI